MAALVAPPAAAERIGTSDLSRLPRVDVVVLGERHDYPVHHINQAEAVASIEPRALVFEMLTPEQALRVPEDRGDAAGMSRALRWEESGWPDFDLYHPIFTAAPDAAVFGGALPRETVRRAVEEGAADVLGPSAPLFGLDRPLSDREAEERRAEQREAHCDELPESLLPGMVEAQRLRDAALARAVIAALGEMGPPVVVITGNGHARTDHGMPRALSRARPEVSILSVGQVEAPPDPPAPFDLWLVTEPVERNDPCASLR